MNKNYLRAVYNLSRVMNDDRYNDDDRRKYIQEAKQNIQENGLDHSSAYVKAKDNLNNLMKDNTIDPTQKRTYILQAMDKLSKNGNPYDIFKEDEEHYENPYVDRYKVKNPNYNPVMDGLNGTPKSEYVYDGALDNAQKSSNALMRSGLSVPKPDEDEKLEEGKKNGWFSGLMHKITSPFYALNKGLKNLADDDKDTGFLQGAKEGFSAGFDDNAENPDRATATDVLRTLLHSNNDIKKGIGQGLNEPIARIMRDFTVLNKITDGKGNEITADDVGMNISDKWHDKATSATGLALDFIEPNPIGWLKGVGKGAQLLSKGTKALNVGEELGGVKKAYDVLKSVGLDASTKDAEYLLKKTSGMLGGIEGYKGIRLGTEAHNIQAIKPETIAKIGDYTVAPTLNKVREIMSNSQIGQTISKMHVNDVTRAVRGDRKNGLEHVANGMADKILQNKANMNKSKAVDDAIDIQKEIYSKSKNGEEMESIISDAIENKKDMFDSENIDKITPNIHYRNELEAERARRFKEAVDERIELQKLKDAGKLPNAKEVDSKINELTKEIDYLDSVGDYKQYYQGTSKDVPYELLQSGAFQTKGNNIIELSDKVKENAINGVKEQVKENKVIDKSEEFTNKIKKNTPLSKILEEEKTPLEKVAVDTTENKNPIEQIIDKVSSKQPLEESTVGKVIDDVNPPKVIVKQPRDVLIENIKKLNDKVSDDTINNATDEQLQKLYNHLNTKDVSNVIDKYEIKSNDLIKDINNKPVDKTLEELAIDKAERLPQESNLKIQNVYNKDRELVMDGGLTEQGFKKINSHDEVPHSIGRANGLTLAERKTLVNEMDATRKHLGKDFEELRFSKQFGIMNSDDYANEMKRLREIRDIYDKTPGTHVAKSRRVQDYLIDTIGDSKKERIINSNANKFWKENTDPEKIEQLNKIQSNLDDDLITAKRQLDNPKVLEDADRLEDIMLDKTAPKVISKPVGDIDILKKKAHQIGIHDPKWSKDVLKGIEEGTYDTPNKISNAIKSIDDFMTKVPPTEKQVTNRLFHILEGDDLKIKNHKLAQGNTDVAIYHYKNTKIGIDKSVPANKVKALFKMLDKMPVEGEKILKNTNQVNLINSYLANGSYGKAIRKYNDVTVTAKETQKLMKQLLNHEIGHIAFNNEKSIKEVADIARNEITKLSKDSTKTLKEAFTKVGITPADDFAKHLTKYVEKSGGDREFAAELSSLFLNSNQKVRDIISNEMPGTREIIDKVVDNIPEIKRTLPNNNKYNKLVEQLTRYKEIKDTVVGGNFAKLDNKINKLATNRSVEQMEKVLSDFTPKEPKEISQTIYKVVKTGEQIDPRVVEAGLTDVMKRVSKDFKRWGNEEEITQMSNYVTHVLNYDLQYTRKGQKTLKKLKDAGIIKEPGNMFECQRRYNGTIKEINDVMKKKTGVDNYFETSITKIYLHRAIKHEDVMLSKKRFNNFMNLFSEKLDYARIQKLDPLQRNTYEKIVSQKLKSGEYTVIQTMDNFRKTPKQVAKLQKAKNGKTFTRVSSEQTVEKILDDVGFSSNNPYIEVNHNRLKSQDLFNGSNNFYIVPTKSLEMYNKVAQNQFKDNSNALLKLYDKFTNTWKAMAVTSGTFHVNNAVGNIFNSYLEIGKDILDPTLNNMARKIQGLSVKKDNKTSFKGKFLSYWAKKAEELGVIGDGFYSMSADSYMKGKISKLTKENKLQKINPLSNNNFVYETNRKAGNAIEEQARLVNFLSHIDKGKTPQEAADLTNKVLFDYSDLTEFESGVMKRIVPFYTFLRKNAPYQLQQMFHHWDRYGKIKEGVNDLSKPETEDQKKFKPDYIDENYVHLGNNKYKDLNFPSQDLQKLVSPKDMIGSLNPLIKLAMELPTNKNIYFDSPIAKDDREKDEKYKEHILKSLVPLANRTGAIPGAFRGEDKDKKKVMGWLTGFKTEEPDLETAKKYAKKKYLDKLQEEEQYQRKQGKIKPKKKNPLGQW